ncbi:MAG: SoxR reducing system RseC family protein [Pseudomonadota bacterium]
MTDDGDACEPQMRRSLRVIGVDGTRVTLEAPRASACASCAIKAGCGTGALAEMLGAKETLCVDTDIPTSVGDVLEVTMDRTQFLQTLLWVYATPALALILVAAMSLVAGLSNGTTAVLLIPALGLALLPMLRAEKRTATAVSVRHPVET